jgi:hypothetical protein
MKCALSCNHPVPFFRVVWRVMLLTHTPHLPCCCVAALLNTVIVISDMNIFDMSHIFVVRWCGVCGVVCVVAWCDVVRVVVGVGVPRFSPQPHAHHPPHAHACRCFSAIVPVSHKPLPVLFDFRGPGACLWCVWMLCWLCVWRGCVCTTHVWCLVRDK